MFHKLRLRLMMVNLGVIFLLFFVLTIGTYLFVQERMTHGRDHMMRRVAEDLTSGFHTDLPPAGRGRPSDGPPPNGGPPDGGPGPMLFFAKVNARHEVIATSTFMPLSSEQLAWLVNQAATSQTQEVIPVANQSEYVFLKRPNLDDDSVLYVFADYRRDRELLQLLVTGLGITGLVCMLLSLLGSYFMANKAMAPIREAWQQQQDFLADASHELRTPLAVIQINLDVVRDNPTETVASQARWLDNIYEELQSTTRLVESLLFLSRADSQQQPLMKDAFSFDQALVATVEHFQPVAALKQIDLSLQTKPGIAYYGDDMKLRQLVGILLDNAIRHTPTNGQVNVSLERYPHSIVLSVADTGEGIVAEELEQIFRRFYQADSSRAKGGAGLGLAIAKWIAESHEGMIQVVSEPGNGSTFTVRLPYTG